MTRAASTEDRLGREIEHFDAVAARGTEAILGWSSPVGRVRADRRARLFVATGGITRGTRVLELGCGTGEFTRRVAPSGGEVVALDISGDLLAKARAKVGAQARFARGNAEVLPFRDSAFDVVYGCSLPHPLAVAPLQPAPPTPTSQWPGYLRAVPARWGTRGSAGPLRTRRFTRRGRRWWPRSPARGPLGSTRSSPSPTSTGSSAAVMRIVVPATGM